MKECREGDYRRYDNDDYNHCINVNKIADIPDYDGLMGVPLQGFFIKCSRRQFEVVDVLMDGVVDGVNLYDRVIIRIRRYG